MAESSLKTSLLRPEPSDGHLLRRAQYPRTLLVFAGCLLAWLCALLHMSRVTYGANTHASAALEVVGAVSVEADSKRAGPSCPASSAASQGVPVLRLVGGPTPPPEQYQWFSRVCTPLYPGPNCSSPTTWNGTVTFCIDGEEIAGAKMHTRGHVSRLFPKQQFTVKLPEARSILGLPASNRFILGMSFIDTSFQRNPTAFDIFRATGGWAPEVRYVRLQWHNEDFGLYYFTQWIKQGPPGDELVAHKKHPHQSDYMFVVDWAKEGSRNFSTTGVSYDIVFPKPKKMTQGHLDYLQSVIDTADSAAAALPSSSSSEAQSLEELVDFESFARYYITEELAADIDGYAFSNFIMVRKGKLVHGPPWDFDLAFGYDCLSIVFRNVFTGEVQALNGSKGWNVENARDSYLWIAPDGTGGQIRYFGLNRRQFFLNLWRHVPFRRRFSELWHTLRQGLLNDVALVSMVSTRSAYIQEEANHDIDLWNQTHRCGFFNCCHPEDATSFEASSRRLSEFLVQRAAWIDAHVDSFLDAAAEPPLKTP